MMLERLLCVLAAQITGLMSPSNICRELGLTEPTFDRYLSYLEQAFLVFTCRTTRGREAAVQKRGRRLYFVDGAIRNAALQRGLAPPDNPTDLGFLVENLVAATLRSLALHTGVRLYHWRDGKHEVDVILDYPDHPVAFEIGLSPDHPRTAMRALHEKHPLFRGRCYLVAPHASVTQPHSTASGIGTLPLDLLLQVVGAQAEKALAASLGTRDHSCERTRGPLAQGAGGRVTLLRWSVSGWHRGRVSDAAERVAALPRPGRLAEYEWMWVAVVDDEAVEAAETSASTGAWVALDGCPTSPSGPSSSTSAPRDCQPAPAMKAPPPCVAARRAGPQRAGTQHLRPGGGG